MNKELPVEEQIERATWAAATFAKYNYRNFDLWQVEYSITEHLIVGNTDSIWERLAKSGVQQTIVVRSLMDNPRYIWWEAVAIAEALEKRKKLLG